MRRVITLVGDDGIGAGMIGHLRRSLVLSAWCAVVSGSVGRAQEHPHGLASLHGEVVDTALRRLPGVLVYLSRARTFGVSDTNGEFTLADVEPGVDTLEVRKRGFTPRAFQVSLPDSARGAIEIGTMTLAPGPAPSLDLTVAVRDTLQRQPVAGAQVMVGDSVVGETDTTGVFAATEIPVEWGTNTVLVRRPGYAPLLRMFWVGELKAKRSLSAVLQRQAFDLPEVVIEADGITLVYGRMREFYQRRKLGWGRFFTRDDIERRHPVHLSEMLQMVPGIVVLRDGWFTRLRSSRGSVGWSQGCDLAIWINGMKVTDADIDRTVYPGDVEAIEVYRDPFETPVQFAGAFNGCGAVVIWTR